MLRSENLYEILDKYFSQIQKNSYYKREVLKFLMKKYEYSDIEYMIIPNQNNKYSSLERFAVTKFDLNNILVYDNDIKKQNLLNAFDGNSRQTFGGNSHFTLNLSDTVTDEVICVDNTMFQFIKGKNMTVLFVPTDADISNLHG